MAHRVVAFVPARSGSERVPGKNVRVLAGHPLLAYAIETARQSGIFERVVVSTDSEEIAEIARWYGADVPFLRPPEYATSTSPDIEWLSFTLQGLEESYDLFAIVRATNPFRGPETVKRGLEQLLATPEADSLRAVERVKQHPGKMWLLAEDGRTMTPLLDQSHLEVAWHAGQYQALPPVYSQSSALEIAWARVVGETGTREGRVVAPFFTDGHEGFNVDDEEDWERAERLVASGRGALPAIERPPYAPAAMKVAALETLFCDAGWRPWIFLKATTDDGLVGWAEITDSHGSPRGLAGIVEDLAPVVVGKDPRATERIYWDLYRHTRQSPGSVIAKAIAGVENALLDIKARALGVPVYELFGGPTRDSIPVYWSHCGTTRARAWEVTGTPKLASYDDVAALGREVVEHGYPAFKTNVVVPGEEPQVLMPGFGEGGGTLRTEEIAEALVRLLDAFREGTGGAARPIVDLNFNLEPEGIVRVAHALEPLDLLWLEVDLFDARRARARAPRRSDADLLRREPVRQPRLPAVPRGGRDGRGLGGRDLERLPPVEEDRRPRGDLRGQLRAAQLLLAPRDVHRRAVVRRHPERAHPRVRPRRRAVARRARHRRAARSRTARSRCRAVPGWGVEVREDVLREHAWPG